MRKYKQQKKKLKTKLIQLPDVTTAEDAANWNMIMMTITMMMMMMMAIKNYKHNCK